MDRAIRFSFYVLIFCLPVSIALVESFASLAVVIFLIKRVMALRGSGKRGWQMVGAVLLPVPSPLNIPLWCFIGATALSFLFSQSHYLSFIGFVGKTLEGYLVYAAFLEAFNEPRYINTFLTVWFTSAFMTMVNGLFQYWTGVDFLRDNMLAPDKRISSSMRHANDLGAYIVTVCPLVLIVLMNWNVFWAQWTAKGKGIAGHPALMCSFFVLIFGILIVCLGLTFSRASWFAFFAGMLLCGLYNKKHLLIAVLIIACFIKVFTPLLVKARDMSLITDNVVNVPNQYVETLPKMNLYDRLHYMLTNLGSGRQRFWQEGFHIIKTYPLFGSGINTYSALGHRYKISWGGYPHNSFIQMTAELGFVGLAMFLWMIFTLVRVSLQHVRQNRGDYSSTVALGAMAGFCGYLIQSFCDTTFYSVQLSILLWIVMGLTMSVLRMRVQK